MSFYLVPEKYDYIPTQEEIDFIEYMLRKALGEIEIGYWENEEAQVVGLLEVNIQKVSCPVCGHIESLINPAAFGEMLFVQSAETIEFEMPCCANIVNLAQVDLTPTTKFSRFVFEVTGAAELSSSQLTDLSNDIGSRFLVVAIDGE